MKSDWKLVVSILVLIALVLALIVISFDKSNKVDRLIDDIQSLKSQPTATIPKLSDGHTPVLGVDYFNGTNATNEQVQNAVNTYMSQHPVKEATNGLDGSNGDSAYDLAVMNGFTGTVQQWLDTLKVKGDKGDTAPELDIDCKDGHIVKRYIVDSFWQATRIKCEVDGE